MDPLHHIRSGEVFHGEPSGIRTSQGGFEGGKITQPRFGCDNFWGKSDPVTHGTKQIVTSRLGGGTSPIPWKSPRPGWESRRCPCPWHQLGFNVPTHLNHSGIFPCGHSKDIPTSSSSPIPQIRPEFPPSRSSRRPKVAGWSLSSALWTATLRPP